MQAICPVDSDDGERHRRKKNQRVLLSIGGRRNGGRMQSEGAAVQGQPL